MKIKGKKESKIDAILVITIRVRGTTYKQVLVSLKSLYNIPKRIIRTMLTKININPIQYSINNLLHKRLEITKLTQGYLTHHKKLRKSYKL